MVGLNPLGAPSSAGLSENEYWVLATQIGNLPYPAASKSCELVRTELPAAMSSAPVDLARDCADLFPEAHRRQDRADWNWLLPLSARPARRGPGPPRPAPPRAQWSQTIKA